MPVRFRPAALARVSRAALAASTLGLLALAGCQDADPPDEQVPEVSPALEPSASATPPPPATASVAWEGWVDPDVAPREQLLAVQGLTPQAVDALIAARPFADMQQIDRTLRAAGTPNEDLREIYGRLWRPIDLNTATREEILLIPGVGERMLGEFLEYRPYASMEQFRREIGKYVDDAELARLERYVTVR